MKHLHVEWVYVRTYVYQIWYNMAASRTRSSLSSAAAVCVYTQVVVYHKMKRCLVRVNLRTKKHIFEPFVHCLVFPCQKRVSLQGNSEKNRKHFAQHTYTSVFKAIFCPGKNKIASSTVSDKNCASRRAFGEPGEEEDYIFFYRLQHAAKQFASGQGTFLNSRE